MEGGNQLNSILVTADVRRAVDWWFLNPMQKLLVLDGAKAA